jgi:hypothetical protein
MQQQNSMAELISSALCELGPGQQWLGSFSFAAQKTAKT